MFLNKLVVVASLALLGQASVLALEPVLPYNESGYSIADAKAFAEGTLKVKGMKDEEVKKRGKAFAREIRSLTSEQDLDKIFERVTLEEVSLPFSGQSKYKNSGWEAKDGSIDFAPSSQPWKGFALIYTAPNGRKILLVKGNCMNCLGDEVSPPTVTHNEPPPAPALQVCLDSNATNFQGFLPCRYPQQQPITVNMPPAQQQQQQQIAAPQPTIIFVTAPAQQQQEQVVYQPQQYYQQPQYYPQPQYVSYQEPHYGGGYEVGGGYGGSMTFAPQIRIGGGNTTTTTNVNDSYNSSSSRTSSNLNYAPTSTSSNSYSNYCGTCGNTSTWRNTGGTTTSPSGGPVGAPGTCITGANGCGGSSGGPVGAPGTGTGNGSGAPGTCIPGANGCGGGPAGLTRQAYSNGNGGALSSSQFIALRSGGPAPQSNARVSGGGATRMQGNAVRSGGNNVGRRGGRN